MFSLTETKEIITDNNDKMPQTTKEPIHREVKLNTRKHLTFAKTHIAIFFQVCSSPPQDTEEQNTEKHLN